MQYGPGRWLPLVMLALLTACGDEPVRKHGLEIEAHGNKPTGEAVALRYDFDPKESWTATLYLDVQMTKPERASSRSTIEIQQVHGADKPDHSTTSMVYRRVESSQGDVEPPKGATRGTFRHAQNGRPLPETRKLTGENLSLADTVYGSMMLAGLGGSDSWIPDAPIREGQAWPASQVLKPRMVAKLLQLRGEARSTMPKPVFRGTIQVRKIERTSEPGAPLEGKVHLRIQALVELKGTLQQRGERGQIDMGYRVEGAATVDLRTGLPLSVDTTATHHMDFRAPKERREQAMKIVLRAETRRDRE